MQLKLYIGRLWNDVYNAINQLGPSKSPNTVVRFDWHIVFDITRYVGGIAYLKMIYEWK